MIRWPRLPVQIPFWMQWTLAHTLGWTLAQPLLSTFGFEIGFVVIIFTSPLSFFFGFWFTSYALIASFAFVEEAAIIGLFFLFACYDLRVRWIFAVGAGWPCGWMLGELLGENSFYYLIQIFSDDLAWCLATATFGIGFGGGLAVPAALFLGGKRGGLWLFWSALSWGAAWLFWWIAPGPAMWISGPVTDRANIEDWLLQAITIGSFGSACTSILAGSIFPWQSQYQIRA